MRRDRKLTEDKNIQLIFDDELKDYVIIWEPPVIISCGKTINKALDDLKKIIKSEIKVIKKA